MHDIRVIEKSDRYGYEVAIDGQNKYFKSKEYNYIFDMKTGRMISWGRTFEDDPLVSPAPNIADIEIDGCCTGLKNNGVVCPFCYKSNTPTSGKWMTFEEFKHIIDVYPKSLTQVAFGSSACLNTNPDIWRMMKYCRENNIVPNVTLANVLTDEVADNLASLCGAVAISRYEDKDICYNSIKKLTDRGMKQVNIHLLFAEEYYERCKETFEDVLTDERLKNLNAIVCLGLKKKGRGTSFHRLSTEHFRELIRFAIDHEIGLGFDSCNSKRSLEVLGESVKDSVISCEATLESSYINYHSEYYPCSFMEGTEDWKSGISLKDINSPEEFIEKVWHNYKTEVFREKLLDTTNRNCYGCRECPYFEI